MAAGPLVSRDGDVYGYTVNLAARLAARAEPDQVLVTQAVVDACSPGSVGLGFTPLGEVELKGVAGRVPVAAAHQPRV
ncbi:MAG: adenylate/guanylate cyclase domain-containing protein [Candidatus Limnocylindrales bacterium]